MGFKSLLSKPFAKIEVNKIKKWSAEPIKTQEKQLKLLVEGAKNTKFGQDHGFDSIKTYQDFKRQVPITDYEGLKKYIDAIKSGESNVLWKGIPIYFCKTSGTTSGTKYIPITKESISNHIDAARNAILCYIEETGRADFVDHKMIFLQGSPELDTSGKIPTGRLSGIVAHHVPNYLQKNRMPSFKVNCIEDWETKVDAIAKETLKENMALISGIPPWVQMYFERLIQLSGKKEVKDIFPKFSLFIYGGVNFAPYQSVFKKLIGKTVDSIELYPASEGFIAFQDSQRKEGMLLNLNAGIFYEFIPADEFFDENPSRINLEDVQIGINYALILNTNAGLWGYNIGDTVKFVSTNPYRIIVSGRIKHFTSAFGEHVIAEEVESAINATSQIHQCSINDFHLAPQVNPKEGELPYHEWFIEFNQEPMDLIKFNADLDIQLQKRNSYYADLIQGNILRPLVIRKMKKNAFQDYMKSIGKLGGQNKLPRLANDRNIADQLINHNLS
ncbi:GH3 auxin-responsive promoter family protein [bacterium]|nr:GH3 auxin-responsive promoter family protein [bacterium]